MKNSKFIVTTLSIILLSFISCTSDNILQNNIDQTNNTIYFNTNSTQQLSLNKSTYSDNTFENGTQIFSKEKDKEKKINNLTIIIFDSNDMLVDIFSTKKMDGISTLSKNSNQYSLKLGYTSNMKYLALANINDSLLTTISNNSASLELFKTIINKQDLNDQLTNDFFMTTESLSPLSRDKINNIELIRKVFRIDISNFTTRYKIKSIELQNQLVHCKIAGLLDSIPNDFYCNKTYYINDSSSYIGKIYSYENNKRNAVLKVTYSDNNNSNIKTKNLFLNLDLIKNTLYQIDFYNDTSGLKDSIYVKDWIADEIYNITNDELDSKIQPAEIYGGGSCPSTEIAYNKKNCGIQYGNLSNYRYDSKYYTYNGKQYYVTLLDLSDPDNKLVDFVKSNKKNKTQVRLRLTEYGILSCVNSTDNTIFYQELVGNYYDLYINNLEYNCTIYLKKVNENLIFKAEGSGHTRFFRIINKDTLID